MNYLILVNNAPLMAEYHKSLGERLQMEGHTVYFAATDYLSIRNVKFESNLFVFSEFFKNNSGKVILDSDYEEMNLWEAYFSDYDRNVTHYKIKPKNIEYYNDLFSNLVFFFSNILKEHNITDIIYENISNSFAYFAYLVAKKNKIRYIGYLPSRLAGRFELQGEIYNNVEEFAYTYQKTSFEAQSADVKNFVINYLDIYRKDVPSYHVRNHPLSYDYPLKKLYLNSKKVNLILNAIKYTINNYKDLKYNYQLENIFDHYFKLFKRQVKRRSTTKRVIKMFDNVDLNDIFYLMPLQFKPESSTSVWAKNYTDDYNNILNICFNLPVGTYLYVKEHFVNLGLPELQYYKKLKEIPNLKLINPNEPNRPLINSSKAVIVLTSTMGFEALILGKKVITLGNIFYQCHPNCIKLDSFKDLFQTLINLNPQIDEKELEEMNKKFIAAYFNLSFEGDIDYVAYDKFDPNKFAELITKALNKRNCEITLN